MITNCVLTYSLFLLLCHFVYESQAKWEFELTIHNYTNPTSEAFVNSQTTDCCDILTTSCDNPCDNIFNFTMSPITCYSHDLSCAYGTYQTSPTEDDDHLTFTNKIGGLPNPLTFNGETWPTNGLIKLIINIDDDDPDGSNDFVDVLVIADEVTPHTKTHPQQYHGIHNISFITMSYRMKCADDYYGPTCDCNSGSEDDCYSSTSSESSDCTTQIAISTIEPVFSTCMSTVTKLFTTTTFISILITPSITGQMEISGDEENLVTILVSSLGGIILLLLVALVTCSILVIILFKKNRRKSIRRRPLPHPPVMSVNSSASVQNQQNNFTIQLEDCIAYEDCDTTTLLRGNDGTRNGRHSQRIGITYQQNEAYNLQTI